MSDIFTPLHPRAMHRCKTDVIQRDFKDPSGRPYEIHVCKCGGAVAFVPLGPPRW